MTRIIMTRPRRLLAALVLGSYIATGFLLETAHRDDLNGPTGSSPAFAAHTCGAHEHHVPLDKWHSCPACLLGSHRVSTPVSPSLMPSSAPLVAVEVPVPGVSHVSSLETLKPSKRGPPSA